MSPRNFALIAGIIYTLIGVLGFVPGMTVPHTEMANMPDLAVEAGYGTLLGFPVNVLHNIVHLLVGLLGLGAFRSFSASRGFARGLAIFYGLLAVLGLLPNPINTTFGLIPIFGSDVLLHAGTALIAAYFGWAARGETTTTTDTTTTGGGARAY